MPNETSPKGSPFKFLDPYGPEDSEFFFGRDRELDELYAKLYASPITVIYGESGTGKTSLIQCGLRSRIPLEDMLFVQVRSGPSPEEALRQALSIAAPYIPEEEGQSLDEYLRLVIRRVYKTVLLVFDPFEEFLMPRLGENRSECSTRLKGFAKRLAEWLEEGLNLRMLFAIRQEFLAHLTELEQELPGLYENRLWLQRMSLERAREVIAGLRQKADIGITPGLARSLLDAINSSGQGVDLPTLQVVLYELYNQAKPHSGGNAIELSEEDYKDLGQISSILGRFVDERIKALGQDGETAKQILKTLATPQSTRCSLAQDEIAAKLSPTLESEYLGELLEALVNKRILRKDPVRRRFELRHDTLAAHVRSWMSEPERELEIVQQSLGWRFGEYQRLKSRLLDAKFLDELAPYESLLNLQGDLEYFVRLSKARIEEDKEAVRKKRFNNIAVRSGIFIIIFLSAVLSLSTVNESKKGQGKAMYDYNMARNAIHKILIVIRTNRKGYLNELESIHKSLLKSAIEYYQIHSSQNDQDTQLKEELAEAKSVAGEILNGDEAKKYSEEAIGIYKALNNKFPDNPDYAYELAKCQIRIGHILHDQGKQENGNWVRQAEISYSAHQKYISEKTKAEDIFKLGEAYTDLGILEDMDNDRESAQNSLNQSINLYKHLLESDPNNPEYLYDLAYSLDKRANVLSKLIYQNLKEMREDDQKAPLSIDNPDDLYSEAIGILEKLISSQNRSAFKQSLAQIYYDRGRFNTEMDDSRKALEAYSHAVELYKQLQQDNPQATKYQKSFQEAENQLILARLLNRQPKEAASESEQALEIDQQPLQLIAKRAHSLLLDGRRNEAWAIYNEKKDKQDKSGISFKQIVEDDFKRLQVNGISHPEMPKIILFLKQSSPTTIH